MNYILHTNASLFRNCGKLKTARVGGYDAAILIISASFITAFSR